MVAAMPARTATVMETTATMATTVMSTIGGCDNGSSGDDKSSDDGK